MGFSRFASTHESIHCKSCPLVGAGFQHFLDPPDFEAWSFTKGALPDPNYSPTLFTELSSYPTISTSISTDLLPPEITPGCGRTIATGAAMPEASVNKHRELLFWEGKIRLSRKRQMAPPTGKSIRTQQLQQPELGGLVTLRGDCRHTARPFLG